LQITSEKATAGNWKKTIYGIRIKNTSRMEPEGANLPADIVLPVIELFFPWSRIINEVIETPSPKVSIGIISFI
jgi:hypothetical protein